MTLHKELVRYFNNYRESFFSLIELFNDAESHLEKVDALKLLVQSFDHLEDRIRVLLDHQEVIDGFESINYDTLMNRIEGKFK